MGRFPAVERPNAALVDKAVGLWYAVDAYTIRNPSVSNQANSARIPLPNVLRAFLGVSSGRAGDACALGDHG